MRNSERSIKETRVLVTGANGFVGRAVCAEAIQRGMSVRGTVRTPASLSAGVENCTVGGMDGRTDWTEALRDVGVIIHLAARVHIMRESVTDPLAEFLKVNLDGTINLARQAARAGVKRIVYVSSIKVNGEGTAEGQVFSELDEPSPQDPYAVSKWRAEQALREIERETGMEVVIMRPPLVYGAGVKGNFTQMLKVLARGIPLPFASVRNLRSLVYVGNLADALISCSSHPAAVGQTYLVSDGEDVSTPDLLRRLGAAMGHPARLFPCPPSWLTLAGRLTGRAGQIERLLGSLRVDSGKICRELGWVPPYTLEQGLRITADGCQEPKR